MFNMTPYKTSRSVMPRGLFDEFSNDFFRPFFEGGFTGLTRPERAMKVDVRDDGDKYTLEADIPGVSKDDLKVEVSNGVLTISANYNQEKEEKGEDERYVYRERRCGSMSRAFNVEGIREDDISAQFKDGVLTLTLPKEPEKALPEGKTIMIEG